MKRIQFNDIENITRFDTVEVEISDEDFKLLTDLGESLNGSSEFENIIGKYRDNFEYTGDDTCGYTEDGYYDLELIGEDNE